MAKRRELKPGDIVRLKPIALLIALKQIEKGEGHMFSAYEELLNRKISITENMKESWNGNHTVIISNPAREPYIRLVNSKGETWCYNLSWIKSVKRK